MRQSFSSSIMSSVGNGSTSVVFVMRVFVQVRARLSGILVNSNFTSRDISIYLSGICIVHNFLMKFSVDCRLCFNLFIIGCSILVKYFERS